MDVGLHALVRKTVKLVTSCVFADPLSCVQLKGTELYTTVIRWGLGE